MTHAHPTATVRRLPLAALLSATVLLAACATPGESAAPLTLATPPAQAATEALPPAAAWWQQLGDERLNRLVEQALHDQPSLAAAQARVRRALALAGQTEAANGPQAQLSVDVTRERYSANGLYPSPIAGNVWNSANLMLGGSWSLDLFGRHQAELAAAIGQAKAAEAEAAATATALAAQVTRSYIGLARLVGQREVALRTREQREALRQLTMKRVQAGLDTRVEQVQADGALPDVGTQIEALDEQIALARRQLAVLAGQPADALYSLTPDLKALSLAERPGVLSADLLGQRADVVAARWRVEATLQDIGAARAQFYPDVNLTAFAGLSSLGLDNLFQGSSRQFGVSPALHLPIFDGGRLRANLRGKEAERDAAIAQYNGVLADALREVGDALTSEASLQRQRAQQGQALAAAEQAYAIAVRRHEAGLGNYLLVLNAESQVLAQRRAEVDLQARQLDTRAALMKALGGGWQAGAPLTTAALAAPAATR